MACECTCGCGVAYLLSHLDLECESFEDGAALARLGVVRGLGLRRGLSSQRLLPGILLVAQRLRRKGGGGKRDEEGHEWRKGEGGKEEEEMVVWVWWEGSGGVREWLCVCAYQPAGVGCFVELWAEGALPEHVLHLLVTAVLRALLLRLQPYHIHMTRHVKQGVRQGPGEVESGQAVGFSLTTRRRGWLALYPLLLP